MDGARRMRSEKPREYQYAKSLDRKRVEWNGESKVEHMWEQVKRTMDGSAREVCASVRVGGKNRNIMWWNDKAKAPVKRKETAWKEMLGVRDEDSKERCMEAYKEEKRKVNMCIYQNKKEVNDHFGMKMNQDVNGHKKLFWKEVSKRNRGKVKRSRIIKDRNGRLAL